MSSKIRMALAGLTVVALAGGLLAANPAEAGKKRKHHHKGHSHSSSSVKQVSEGGDAKGGNGGNGGKGGSSGNVNNTGNVGVGTPATPDSGPGVGVTAAQGQCMVAGIGVVDTVAHLLAGCFGPAGPPAAFAACIAAATPNLLTVPEVQNCLTVVPGTPAVPGGSGSVFSGNGGAGASGGTGGNAIGGNGGDNSNTSQTTVSRDDHSIEVAH